MSSVLKGMKIAVLGGDDRELFLIPKLNGLGAEINVVGYNVQETGGVRVYEDMAAALTGIRVVILPMPGIDANGKIRAKYADKPLILTEEILQRVPRDALIFIGMAKLEFKAKAAKYGLKVIELADIDEIAILNSIPSAEGAIQMAMSGSDITIHGSNSLVIGFGRCGTTLARMLSAMGAKTSVVARKAADLARVLEMGMQPVKYQELPNMLKEVDFVFNTVPAMILNGDLLQRINSDVYIIDIASAPGGVDYQAAKTLGIKADLAPGLPGLVAPKTAGHILAKIIPQLIERELSMTSPGKNG